MQEKVAQKAAEKGVLLVRVHDLPTSGGILGERQRRWLETAPYDNSTENPVLYKLVSMPNLQRSSSEHVINIPIRHSVEAAKPSTQATERESARLEVQSLPDKPG